MVEGEVRMVWTWMLGLIRRTSRDLVVWVEHDNMIVDMALVERRVACDLISHRT